MRSNPTNKPHHLHYILLSFIGTTTQPRFIMRVLHDVGRAKGETCNDLVPIRERMDKAGHGGCITNWRPIGKRRKMIKVTAAQIAPSDQRER